MKAIDQPHSTVVRFLTQEEALKPSCWIAEIFSLKPIPATSAAGKSDPPAAVACNDCATLITVRLPGATRLRSSAFERAATGAYAAIRDRLHGRHPARFWNHIPAIHAAMDAERDRYMVFNAGRFRAFENWYGSADAFARQLATASGVGHPGTDLVVHCLALPEPGLAIENPRQIASYRYSRRYGPLPPCFARATTVRSPRDPSVSGLLLIGGTASIRGEDSVHPGRLNHQLDETFENLAALVAAASADAPRDDALSRYRHLRIYYRHGRDAGAIHDAVTQAFSSLRSAEFVQAELCRQELLVEIEGVAEL